ncbi:type 4a pilus biogenesis protein PilO [Candidatus Woesebacteria bacterium]|nr:type 4a pilus biogenesis protein PilO [Candidatus Woesebacteria bacterium]HNV45145.1 type 4a pilus biogenesis protein PilO [Candidatus Woesebacteria bacterium]
MPIEKKEEVNFKLIWNTRKEYVLAILCFVLAFLIFFMVILRQIEPVKDVFAELDTTNQELEKFQTKADELDNISVNGEFDKMTEINDVLPSYKPLLELLNNLNSVAVESETIINNFSLSPGEIATDSTITTRTRRQKYYDELVLEFSVTGSLGNVQNFMTLIEQVTPISTITNIALSQQVNENSAIETTANLKLKTFYFTQPITVTLTEPLPPIDDEQLILLEEIKKLIPNNLPTQEEVITNDRGNLFGLEGMTVEELETQLQASELEMGDVQWQTVDETGQPIEQNQAPIEQNQAPIIENQAPIEQNQTPIIEN